MQNVKEEKKDFEIQTLLLLDSPYWLARRVAEGEEKTLYACSEALFLMFFILYAL